ncbi:hypothetical protein BKA56DRAFT_287144 [Ilyonectria sp. MPI-CAGE-AT-0026]|nr:hypothetical protein BKA56DRAFT_287144 [Ilyonectria sp. MPI-CAGE-AT-0026]
MYAEANGNFSTMENMARGLASTMTAAIRNKPSNGEFAREAPITLKHANGAANIMQTCIYVEWGWIAYPAALLVLQGIFPMLVLAVMRRTRFYQGPRHSVWKASPLALLFYGLDDDIRRGNMDLRTVGQMDKAARKGRVQLSHVDGVDDQGRQFCAN